MSENIKISKSYRHREYTLYGVNAIVVKHVLEKNILKFLLHKMTLKEAEEALYKILGTSLIGSERRLWSKKLITDILQKVLGIDISTLFDTLSKYEYDSKFYPFYREHTIHQLQVFLMGLYISDTNEYIEQNIKLQYVSKEEFYREWAVTALCHDLGYIFEVESPSEVDFAKETLNTIQKFDDNVFDVYYPEIGQELLEAQKDEISNELKFSRHTIKSFVDIYRYDNTVLIDMLDELLIDTKLCNKNEAILAKYYELTKGLKVNGGLRETFIDHGIASTCILLFIGMRNVYIREIFDTYLKNNNVKIDDRDSKEILQLIKKSCSAIALHNIEPSIWDQDEAYRRWNLTLNKFVIEPQKNILAFILIFCDNLQDWDRPSFSLKGIEKNDMQSQDFYIISKKDEIGLCYLTDLAQGTKIQTSYFNKFINKIGKVLHLDSNEFKIVEYTGSKLPLLINEFYRGEAPIMIEKKYDLQDAYQIYKEGRKLANLTEWSKAKGYHQKAAEIFVAYNKLDWASRSYGRVAFNAFDLNEKIVDIEDVLSKAYVYDKWQGTANYYWFLEHCIRSNVNLDTMKSYWSYLIQGLKELQIVDWENICDPEWSVDSKYNAFINYLQYFFECLLEMEKENKWPEWSMSDRARMYVLKADSNESLCVNYLQKAKDAYEEVGLKSYAAWTQCKITLHQSTKCNETEIIQYLREIMSKGKEILQTPGGPRDIVLFSMNVISFYYHVLLFIQKRNEDDKKSAKIQLSIIESYDVMDTFVIYKKSVEIYEKLDEMQFEKCSFVFRSIAKRLASFETNQLKLLFR